MRQHGRLAQCKIVMLHSGWAIGHEAEGIFISEVGGDGAESGEEGSECWRDVGDEDV